MNGERFDATEMAHAPWRALVDHPDYEDLVLIECGLRASRVTRLGRQFFAHYPSVDCKGTHKSESAQHLAMKKALKARINTVPGWRAEVEEAHPERAWIADVMATHETGRRMAFEVQLSAQGEDEYIRRSQRYIDDGVAPVWVVPENLDWFRVKLPMIVTGFGKTSALPQAPAELMELTRYQPMFRIMARVAVLVDRVLDPSFVWPHGTPQRQWDAIKQRDAQRAEAAEAAKVKAAQEAQAKQLADQEEVRRKDEQDAMFPAQAVALDVTAAPAVKAGMNVWASIVKCPGSSHPFLIWRVLQPPVRLDLRPYRPGPESLGRVLAPVDTWLGAGGSSLVRGKLVTINRPGKPLGFACPVCGELIQGRLVSSLPHTKWSVIAERIHAPTEARMPATPPTASAGSVPSKEPALRVQTVHRRAAIEEGHPAFIGPRRWAYWMSEANDPEELAARTAAKDAKAARMRAISENPRYTGSANGFRFQCTDCGGSFEDDNEGIHANTRCLTQGARSSGWQ